MAWKAARVIVAGALADGFARLVDLAPGEMTVFTEEGDLALVGGDFRDAIDTVVAEHGRSQPTLPFERDALVEAE